VQRNSSGFPVKKSKEPGDSSKRQDTAVREWKEQDQARGKMAASEPIGKMN